MQINTLFFGITTDLVGDSSLEIDIDENTSIKMFKSILQDKFTSLTKIHSYAIAVNEAYTDDAYVLKDGDVVAVIPPVSGG